MRFLFLASVFLTVAIAAPLIDEVDVLSCSSLANLVAYEALGEKDAYGKSCNVHNAVVRREWSDLSLQDRKKYTDAVRCLMTKPPLHSKEEVPGARSRYDDFVAIHINQTRGIHQTGNFLAWHRYYTWTYEKALRDECGYEGYQPYWAWEKYAHDPIHSPIFDGSEYSMGGNGEFVPHDASQIEPWMTLPPGSGGGCVTTGPFKDMTVHLGPVSPTLKIPGLVAQKGNGFDYNPRCLRRDVSVYASEGWTKTSDVAGLIKNYTTIEPFQKFMQGVRSQGYLGVHAAGHFTIGGDPGGDIYTSPGDPAFFIHHSMIDRVFWIWQNQDPPNRRNVIAGTITMLNDPPSRNTTLDDYVDLGVLAEPRKIRDLLSTLDGPFCYIYT